MVVCLFSAVGWGSEKAEGGEEAEMSIGNETSAAWKNDVLYIPD